MYLAVLTTGAVIFLILFLWLAEKYEESKIPSYQNISMTGRVVEQVDPQYFNSAITSYSIDGFTFYIQRHLQAYGTTTENGIVYIRSDVLSDPELLMEVCNHEVLHSWIDLPGLPAVDIRLGPRYGNKILYNDTYEHMAIYQIEEKVRTDVCEKLVDEIELEK